MAYTVLLKSWWFNVGDGFVKYGAEHILNQIYGSENVLIASALGANKYDMLSQSTPAKGFPSVLDALDGSVDRVVLAGCVLSAKLHRIADKIEQLRIRPQIIFLGAGARSYGPESVAATAAALQRLKPDILISRDSSSLEHFGSYFGKSQQGIDCAYWVSDAVSALPSRKDYQIRTFNRMKDPGPVKHPSITLDHAPFRLAAEPRARVLRRIMYRSIKPTGAPRIESSFISDNVPEYLQLYSAACEVHTDMVHATVAAAAYGTPVHMYHRSPRQEVISSVLGEEIFNEISEIDTHQLKTRKEAELRSVIELLGI